jgi:DNA-binding response OmpR family regulator
MKVLFAEDETDLREVVTAYLTYQGYHVDAVSNGREAVEKAASDAYDTLVLDVMMPEMDGVTAMRQIRETGNTTPAIFLTAKAEVADRVEGLDAGADDYLTKPFSMEELSARLRALGRRKREYKLRVMSYGNLELDTEASEIRALNTIGLAHREVRLLSCLLANIDREMSAEDLLREVWNNEPADANTVWMYISFLNAKLQSIRANVIIDGNRNQPYRLKEI